MAASEVMIEAPEVYGGMQKSEHPFVHTNVASVPDRHVDPSLPQTSTHPREIERPDVSPISQKSKASSVEFNSSTTSQGVLLDANQNASTPASSALSSQEQHSTREGAEMVSGVPLNEKVHEMKEHMSARSSTGSPVRPDISSDVVSERKRTASGQVKRSSISSIHDLKTETSPRHSRTSSLISHGSNGSVMELSQQLRTRLTYAMVKVQNGWQSRSLEEVESLASQSPRSTVSGFPHTQNRQSIPSPKTAMSANLQRTWSSSDSSDDGPTPQYHPTRNGHVNGMHAQQQASRGLGPPADIVSGSRRRQTPNMNTNGLGPLSPTKTLHSARPLPKLRTPSQNAAMEADAVETLLFMASPNNSGHHPKSFAPTESSLRMTQPMSSQMSPLRSQFSYNEAVLSPKKFALSSQNGTPKGKVLSRTVEIERMLDESDGDSGNELDQAIQLASMAGSRGPIR